MKRYVPVTATIVILLSGTLQLHRVLTAQDWPQWRGPNRDGNILSPLPREWPEKLTQKWQTTVGTGHSSPLLSGQNVYTLTRQGEQEVVSCIRFDTGKQVWQDRYPAPYTMNPAATSHGKGPKSTPVLHAGRLFTFGISGILSSYEANSGRLRWRKEFAADFKSTSPLYGSAMSPMVHRGLVIAHVGGHDSGALTAFDAETGRAVWSWKGDGPSYSSPILAEVAGTNQIVTQSQDAIIGISAENGTLLWKIPFTTAYIQNTITPILYRETLIFSGLDKGTTAWKLGQAGGKWKAEKVWENPEVSFYMSTPVLSGDRLFGLSNKRRGQFVALDAATGRQLWASAGREAENVAVLAAGDRLFLLTDNAELIVAKTSGHRFEQIRRYTVARSPTWAHPVLAGKNLLVKDAETLTLWSVD